MTAHKDGNGLSRLLILAILSGLVASRAFAADLAEVRLMIDLDEPRGYCLDLAGYKQRANPSRPLQVHTCYAYQGAIAVDQGIAPALARRGIFRFVHFGVCLQQPTGPGPTQLAPCPDDDGPALVWNGQGIQDSIGPAALCLMAAAGAGRPGGGGTPVHLRRALAWEPCVTVSNGHRQWAIR